MKLIGATDTVGGYIGAVPAQSSGSPFGAAFTKFQRHEGWVYYSSSYFNTSNQEGPYFTNGTYNMCSYRVEKDLFGNFEIQSQLTATGCGPFGWNSSTEGSQGWGLGAITGTASLGSNFAAAVGGDGNYIFFACSGLNATSGSLVWRTGYHTYSPGSSTGGISLSFSAMNVGDIVGVRRIESRFEVYRIRSGVETILGSSAAAYWPEKARVCVHQGAIGSSVEVHYPYLKWRAQNTQGLQRHQDLLSYAPVNYAIQQNDGSSEGSSNATTLYFAESNDYAFFQNGQTKGDFEVSVRFHSWNQTGGSITNSPDGAWGCQLGIGMDSTMENYSTITSSFVYHGGNRRFWIGLRETGANKKVGLFASDSKGIATEITAVYRDVVGTPIVKLRRKDGLWNGYLGEELIFENIQSLITTNWNPSGWTSANFTGPVIPIAGTNASNGVTRYKEFQITLAPKEQGEKSNTPKGCFTIKEAYQKAKLNLWIPSGAIGGSSFTLGSTTGLIGQADYEGYRYLWWVGVDPAGGRSDGQSSDRTGSITSSQAGTVEWLLIAGGGAGGYTDSGYNGGGGGAGGVVWAQKFLFPAATTYNITAGGAAYRSLDISRNYAAAGRNSIFGSYTALAGGGGAGYASAYVAGDNGGSAGGSENTTSLNLSTQTNYYYYTANDHIFSWGNRGGACTTAHRSGGGGGAFTAGGDVAGNGSWGHASSPNRKYINGTVQLNGGSGLYLPEWHAATNLGWNGFFATGGSGGTYNNGPDPIGYHRGSGYGGGSQGESGGDGRGCGSGGGGRGDWRYNTGNHGGAGGAGCFIIRWKI